MVKLTGPLMSLEARGSLGPGLTYSERKSGSQVRFQQPQKDNITPARTIQRKYFIIAITWWYKLTSTEQQEWHSLGNEG